MNRLFYALLFFGSMSGFLAFGPKQDKPEPERKIEHQHRMVHKDKEINRADQILTL